MVNDDHTVTLLDVPLKVDDEFIKKYMMTSWAVSCTVPLNALSSLCISGGSVPITLS